MRSEWAARGNSGNVGRKSRAASLVAPTAAHRVTLLRAAARASTWAGEGREERKGTENQPVSRADRG